MRLFSASTPRTSPELVRHSLVTRNSAAVAEKERGHHSMPADRPSGSGSGSSPGLVRGVSTLGRKVSRRFEKFGESETARRLRIVGNPNRFLAKTPKPKQLHSEYLAETEIWQKQFFRPK